MNAYYERNFVHLHNHTQYSLRDGASRIPELIDHVKALHMPAVAITDHGNMHGAYELWSTAVKAGVKPIIGIEAYVTPGTAHDDGTRVFWGTEQQRQDDVSGNGLFTHMTMWAENDEGLTNLMKASSAASLEAASLEEQVQICPRMDKTMLATYAKGVIASSGCPSGAVQTRLRLGQFDKALREAEELQDIYGRENFFIELMDHGLKAERQVTEGLLEIAKRLDAPLLATNDTHYLRKKDAAAQDAMVCINTYATLDDPDRFRFKGGEYYLKSAEKMRAVFKDFPEACDNTLEVAERCNVMFDDHAEGAFMPRFDCPEGWDETSLFLKTVEEGLEKRYGGNVPEEVRNRADYECGVICRMQFPGYFLVVADYINWAKNHGIMVGPWRGSAAGAIVAYAMGITELDPLRHGLIFEQFLNPERTSLPDIDVDFDLDGRAKVLEYVTDKYGHDKVAQCVIYGTIKTKQALRDSTRIMGYERQMGDMLVKALPSAAVWWKTGLRDVFDPKSRWYSGTGEFRELYESDPDAKRIVDVAMGIEGLIRQTSRHASAMIVASEPVADIVSLMKQVNGSITTAFECHTCETLGLAKMDFLGRPGLTIIRDTLHNIELNGKRPIEYTRIPLDDKATYELLSRGDTLGVFQLDGDGMRSLLRTLKPTNFNGISALIALYRPGPVNMGLHANYVKRKNGLQKIAPVHPEVSESLRDVLDETCGLILYQEQIQSIVHILAGYSLGKTDMLRRAMADEKPKELLEKRISFSAAMREHGYSGAAADAVWDTLMRFSGCAFNKAHAMAYALISYRMAYLKAHYPAEFMAALLQTYRWSAESYLDETRRLGIAVFPPDVNKSQLHHTAVGDTVRLGLGMIRNVSEQSANAIIAERDSARGPYTGFMDFIHRAPSAVLDKRVVKSLIKAGAFDSINPNRHALFMTYATAIDVERASRRKEAKGQRDLFASADDGDAQSMGDAQVTVPDMEEWDRKTKLRYEHAVLGVYVSDHQPSDSASVPCASDDVNDEPHSPVPIEDPDSIIPF